MEHLCREVYTSEIPHISIEQRLDFTWDHSLTLLLHLSLTCYTPSLVSLPLNPCLEFCFYKNSSWDISSTNSCGGRRVCGSHLWNQGTSSPRIVQQLPSHQWLRILLSFSLFILRLWLLPPHPSCRQKRRNDTNIIVYPIMLSPASRLSGRLSSDFCSWLVGPPVSVRDTGKGGSLAGHINTHRNKVC